MEMCPCGTNYAFGSAKYKWFSFCITFNYISNIESILTIKDSNGTQVYKMKCKDPPGCHYLLTGPRFSINVFPAELTSASDPLPIHLPTHNHTCT